MRMKRHLSNEKGVTLVELLAGLVIATIIMLLVFNIMLTVQEQYNAQSEDAGGLFDVTLAAKEITKEIRKNPGTITSPDEHTIIFNETTENEIIFKFQDKMLLKNNINFVNRLEEFSVEIDEGKVILDIVSNEGSSKSIHTEIIIR